MKRFMTLMLFVFSVFCVSAVKMDGGASIDSSTGLSQETDSDFNGTQKVSAYGSFEFSENLSLNIDGYYQFYHTSVPVDITDDSGNTTSASGNTHTADLSLFLLSWSLPMGNSDLTVLLGRGSVSDYSSMIVSHVMDGVSVSVPFSFGTMSFNVGYTGLLNYNAVSLNRPDDEHDVKTQPWLTTAQFLIEGVDYIKTFDELTIWGSLYAMQDMNPEYSGKNLPFYLSGGIEGSLTGTLYYSAGAVLETGVKPFLNSSNNNGTLEGRSVLAGRFSGDITWYLPGEIKPVILGQFGLSSGDSNISSLTDGSDTAAEAAMTTNFNGISSSYPGSVFSIENQNLIYGKISGSVNPMDILQVELGVLSYFKAASEGPVSISLASHSGSYLGTEIYTTVNARIFSDLGASLSGGIFIPDEGVYESAGITGSVSLYVSITI